MAVKWSHFLIWGGQSVVWRVGRFIEVLKSKMPGVLLITDNQHPENHVCPWNWSAWTASLVLMGWS
jgi:hypothetical protein